MQTCVYTHLVSPKANILYMKSSYLPIYQSTLETNTLVPLNHHHQHQHPTISTCDHPSTLLVCINHQPSNIAESRQYQRTNRQEIVDYIGLVCHVNIILPQTMHCLIIRTSNMKVLWNVGTSPSIPRARNERLRIHKYCSLWKRSSTATDS